MTHIEWKLANILPEEHEYQMLAQLSCSERKWCDFLSFDDRLPPRNQWFLKRMDRDEERISKMECDVIQFISEVEAMVEKLGD